jgi:hypothetical protein
VLLARRRWAVTAALWVVVVWQKHWHLLLQQLQQERLRLQGL